MRLKMRVHRRFMLKPAYSAMSSDGPYARLVELWMLRSLVYLGADDMLDACRLFHSGTVLTRVGLKKYANEDNYRYVRAAMRRRLHLIEKQAPRLADSPLAHNVSGFASMLGLTETEREIVTFLVLLHSDGDLAATVNALGRVDLLKVRKILSTVLARRQEDINVALRATGILRHTGIVGFDFDQGEDFGSSVEVAHGLHDALLECHPDPSLLLDHLVPRSATASLSASNFAHIEEDYTLIHDYLGNTGNMGIKGCNILIYGPPGTGKTELVRTLCQDLGYMLHEIAMQDREGSPLEAKNRLVACQLAQRLLARHTRTALLFDEIEDIFPRDPLFGAQENASRHKAWINRLIEGGHVPTFWVSNSIDGMDPAYLRRFDYILKLKSPGISFRTQFLKGCFVPLGVSDTWIERLARFDEITPAHAERAARVGQCVAGHDGPKVERIAERVLQNMLQASGMKTRRPVQGSHATRYDLAHVNADQDLDTVIAGVGRSGAGRSWEVTQVGELLVQMESFDGIFIASTNLMPHLDAAALRRFDFKIRFDFLKPAQRFAMFRDLLHAAGWVGTDELNLWTSEIGRLDALTPGDFSTVARKMRILGAPVEPRWVIEALRKECAAKPGARDIPMGFAGPARSSTLHGRQSTSCGEFA